MMHTNRYFIGLTLPENITRLLEITRHKVFMPQTMLSPLQPHITLLHPNALMQSPPEDLLPKIRAAVQPFLPVKLTLTSLGWFDRRVIYLAVDCPALAQLQSILVAQLPEKIQAKFYDNREFTSHVTLSQAKPYQKLPEDLLDIYSRDLQKYLPSTCTISTLTLFRWQSPRHYKISPIN
jgi:2'-5' RNA ligase